MNYHKLIFISLIFIALASCKNKKADQKRETPPVAVDVIIAGAENFSSNIEVNGTVLSQEMIELHPEISGRITYLNIPDGALVTQGTLLVRINDEDLQAQLGQQKVQLDLATKTEQRLKTLLAVNGIDQATYDAALSQLNLIQANIKVLNAQIDKTMIKAPFTGNLGLRQVSLGAYVSPSTVLGTLQQIDKIKIDFTVPSTYQNLLKIGDTVIVESSGTDKREMARISAIEPQVNTISRNIKVRAKMNSILSKPGSFVKIFLQQNKKGIVVPANAIIPDALSNQVILIKNGKGTFKNVETGERDSENVEILKGINYGDTVIVSGVLFVRPNAKVRVKKVVTIGKNKH
jgi:membrane fusion protein, multidrug efflux system